MHFYICSYTVMFKIIAVCLKKLSKAQNPYNNLYFNTHKCIGNTAHYIPNQNMKKKMIKFVITFQKVKEKEY